MTMAFYLLVDTTQHRHGLSQRLSTNKLMIEEALGNDF